LSGIMTIVAGSGSTELPDGSIGDNGPAKAAALSGVEGVSVDSQGRIYIPDQGHQRIRRVDATGTITTIAGNGRQGSSGDGGPAVSASLKLGYLSGSMSLVVDASGNIYFADTGNHKIRRIDGRSGIITTVAGIGIQGFSGDGGTAKTAALSNPASLALDEAGNLYISDSENQRIRVIRGPIP
jgi:trimeric autotransporter adhesin